MKIPVRRAVRRIKYTRSQTHVESRAQRFENVKGCFGPASWFRLLGRVRGRTVCIVDNLLVTGATLYEVSKVLRRAGAKRIYAAVIGRTVLAGDFQAAAVPEAQVAAP